MKDAIKEICKKLKLSKNAPDSVGVCGDIILDQLSYGDCLSGESQIYKVNKNIFYPGGAANTALNVQKMAGRVNFYSVLGNEGKSDFVKTLLQQNNVETRYVVSDSDHRICHKRRLHMNRSEILRIDDDYIWPCSAEASQKILTAMQESADHTRVLILSDYQKGCISEKLFFDIKQTCLEKDQMLLVDTKRMLDFNGIYLLKVNLHEFTQLYGRSVYNILEISRCGKEFAQANQITNLIITLGSKGGLLIDKRRKIIKIDAIPCAAIDTCGAGDTLIAALSICLANNIDLYMAVQFANTAAALCCCRAGTAAVSLDEIELFLNQI